MGVEAVPAYIKHDDLKGIPPGHRFSLFFPVWKAGTWDVEKDGKTQALRKVLDCPNDTVNLIHSIRTRQASVAKSYEDAMLTLEAESVSPFLTGIGQEHPVENGFTFMNPFGIPYLPGSGVKGVVRRAMEGMALGEWPLGDVRCSLLDVWVLFGFEAASGYLGGCKLPKVKMVEERGENLQKAYMADMEKEDAEAILAYLSDIIAGASLKQSQKDEFRKNPREFVRRLVGSDGKSLREAIHNQGRLIFWDVYPEIAGKNLSIDILTPHYMEYYQGDQPPADCGQPKPNPFLTVPPGSKFTFRVQLGNGPLPGDLGARWRPLLETAFETAFHWLGFGAKTSVGYGQMRHARRSVQSSDTMKAETDDATAKSVSEEAKPIIWEKAHVSYSPGGGGIVTATREGQRAKAKKDDLKDVPPAIAAKLFGKKKKAEGVRVEVRPVGNSLKLLHILE